MKKTLSIDILERYIVHKCTPEEKLLVRDWYRSLEKEPDYVSDLNESEELRLEEEIYNKILSRIQDTGKSQPIIIGKKHNFKILYAAAGIAALFLICFTIVFNRNKTTVANPLATVVKQPQNFVVKNNSKKIYKATLPDGSTIWLSPNAEIKYPAKFDPKFRMISFSGESFFEITKNPDRPFIINSRSIITKVWGTSFRIRDGVKVNTTEVSVVTGKVSVSIRNPAKKVSAQIEKEEIMLYPDQNIVLSNGQQVLKAEKVKNKTSLQIWTRVNLSFDNAKLKDIVPILNEKFNVQLVVTNEKLNNYVLNADFTEFNLPDVLQALKKTLGIDYELKDTNIELK